jgi:superfamily I DNA/RNA helicase
MNQIAIICRSNKRAFEIYSNLKEDESLSSYVKIESGLKSKTKDFISKGISAIEDEILREQIIQALDNEELTFENMINNNKVCSILENTEYSYLLKCKDESLKNAMLQKSTGYETITIITVHGSKGLEYENVIIANDYIKEDNEMMLTEDLISQSGLSNDEINIIYTASTRAKESLFFMEGQLYDSLQSKIKEYSILNSNSLSKKNLCYLKSTILPINKETKGEKIESNNNKNIFEHRNLLFLN